MRTVPTCLALLLCAASVACTIWKNPPKGWAGATGGEQLERQFWKDVSQQQWSSVQKHLATNFKLATASGFYGPKEAIEYWKGLQLQDYSLGDFQLQPNGADVTVACVMNTRGSNDQNAAATDPLYVMSIWQEVGSRWILIAQSLHPAKATR